MATTAELAGQGASVQPVLADVSDTASVEALRDAAIERFGRVHVVCNNAGVGGAMPGTAIDLDEWRWVVDVNLRGVINGHHAFLPHLLEHDDGHIVNTASMAGHVPNHSAYAASKWAVVALTEGLFPTPRASGSDVGVTCVCPGLVNTNFASSDRNRPTPGPTADSTFRTQFADLLRRGGVDPADVADLVHDAVVERRFWVFTDPAWVARLASRLDAVLAGEDPPPREPR